MKALSKNLIGPRAVIVGEARAEGEKVLPGKKRRRWSGGGTRNVDPPANALPPLTLAGHKDVWKRKKGRGTRQSSAGADTNSNGYSGYGNRTKSEAGKGRDLIDREVPT